MQRKWLQVVPVGDPVKSKDKTVVHEIKDFVIKLADLSQDILLGV